MKNIGGVIAILLGMLFIGVAFVSPTFSVINVQQANNPNAPIENTTLSQWNYGANPGWSLSNGNLKISTSIQIPYRIFQSQTIKLSELGIQAFDYQITSSSNTYGFEFSQGWVNLSVNGVVVSNSISPYQSLTGGTAVSAIL